jgi:hypothetical protein
MFSTKKEGQLYKKINKSVTPPASTADPKKVEKVDFDFAHFFLSIFVSGSSMWFESSKDSPRAFRSEY